MKLYYFYTLKVLWDGHGKIKMQFWMSRVKMQLSGKRSISSKSEKHSPNFNYIEGYVSP